MSLTCILLDTPIDGSPGASRAGGVLDLPLPRGSLLEFHRERLAGLSIDRVVVLDGEGSTPVDRNSDSRVTRLDRSAWAGFLDRAEPADLLLLVDARRVQPYGDGLRSLLASAADSPPVRYLLTDAAAHGAIEESAELSDGGQLHRLRRRFHGVTHHGGSAVFATVLPAGILRDALGAAPPDLATLRGRLSAAGVPAIDLLATVPAVDVSRPAGVLELLEHRFAAESRGAAADAARQPAASTWIAPDACVDASARLIGAVAVHGGAEIGPGCRIIGPAVIGPRARIEAGALLSRVCVWPGSRVASRAQLADQIVAGDALLPPERAYSPFLTTPVGCPAGTRPMGLVSRVCKRAADLVLSAGGLLLLSPLLAVVAALIRLTSPGPIFFGHEREGRDGRRFMCWKFRTMVPDAHARQRELYAQNKVDGPQFKMDRDPRVTPIGDFLRKSNLDELPQLFNVLRGDMSLIGPRPSPFRENQLCMPWRKTRLAVQPGITGLWQVCRHDRGESDFYQWIYFDNLYVEHQSVRLDLAILFVTLVTLGGRWPIPVDWLIPAARRGAAGRRDLCASR